MSQSLPQMPRGAPVGSSQTAAGKRILVVEDDPSIVLGLRMNLEAEGYSVDVADDGEAGLLQARRGQADLIILDIMLPRLNGFEVLRQLRAEGVHVPTIVLSAREAEPDIVMGLEFGAEDYVTKPFGIAELLARIKAVLRRPALHPAPREGARAEGRPAAGGTPSAAAGPGTAVPGTAVSGAAVSGAAVSEMAVSGAAVSGAAGPRAGGPGMGVPETTALVLRELRVGELEIDARTRQVTRGGDVVALTATEFDILWCLVQADGRVLGREEIQTLVWGPGHHGTLRTIDNFMMQLRTKLERDPGDPQHLLTVRGVGYRLKA